MPLLLPTSTPRQSGGGRSANRQGSLTSRLKNVGPKGHTTHQAGNVLFLFVLVKGIHDQIVYGPQLLFVLNDAEDALAVFLDGF